MSKKVPLINRDLSWLSFNSRVLQEAEDTTVPLIERMRFLGIFSNNRDEFFRVRVATIKRMVKWPHKGKQMFGEFPGVLLENIQKIVIKQQRKFEKIYESILSELKKENIFLVNELQLSDAHKVFVKNYFHDNVYPFLVPIMLESAPKFPYLKDKSTYLIIKIIQSIKDKKWKYALIELPTDVVSRFLVLPPVDQQRMIIMLDDVIRLCLDDIFSVFSYEKIESYAVKITRDAELDIDGDISKSLMEKVSRSVKMRKKGAPVRLAYDEKIPEDLLNFMLKKINMAKSDYLIAGGRYHNFRDFMKFPDLGKKNLRYNIPHPADHPELKGQRSVFKVIRQRDVLLAYPYQSFHHVIDLLREASIDPKVESIKITLYRAANNSGIVNALINAVKNGKNVTAIVELQARFDEEANIAFANKLQEEGALVIFGVPGLKVHSKLFLIARKEDGKTVHYAHLGTGNFNEQTAKLYCDHSLLTSNKKITEEVVKLFSFYRDNFKTGTYKRLLVSPFSMRKKFLHLINQEIKNAEAGKPAYMYIKLNSLVDTEMIRKLYQASEAGVKIKMIIRGICSLVTNLKGTSDNIEVVSIVDKFLEHSRIFIFANNGDEKYFISSADWMYRNLDHRSEVAIPIYDKEIQKQLMTYLLLQLHDNNKARIIDTEQNNEYKKQGNGPSVRSQDDISRWLNGKWNPDKLLSLSANENDPAALLNIVG
ncbi:MAG: polyphosphate kinase 1 [Bacteroidota bacterium]